MDYLTRRAAAFSGHRPAHLSGSTRYPRAAALGVRVERDGSIARREISQALHDLALPVTLPPGDRVPAEMVESALSAHTPEKLAEQAVAFLSSLAARSKSIPVTAEVYAAIEHEAVIRGRGMNALLGQVADLLRHNPALIPGRPDL